MNVQEIANAAMVAKANAVLDDGGVHDSRVTIGYYKRGNSPVPLLEARLIGGSEASKANAERLLKGIIKFPAASVVAS
jgi:hypothetical protein